MFHKGKALEDNRVVVALADVHLVNILLTSC